MSCPQCIGIEQSFDDREAAAELARYRRKGPRRTTQLLIDAVAADGTADRTILDVGGGVGVVHLALLAAGARRAVDVDASSAFLSVARSEAVHRGVADRVTYRHGNFAEVAAEVPATDVVTLDRVICCYDDVDALLGTAADHARQSLGLVHPRDVAWARAVNALLNAFYRLRGTPFRTFVHPRARVEGILRAAGFERSFHRHTFFWQVEIFRRVRR